MAGKTAGALIATEERQALRPEAESSSQGMLAAMRN